jgi:hypothetical protein
MDAPLPDKPQPPGTGTVPSIDGSPETLPEHSGSAEAAEEVDVWWGSYAGRTMTPSFLLVALLTGALIGAAYGLSAWQGSNVVRYNTLGLVLALWLAQLARWVYRMVAFNYRLTTRRLFREYGFRRPDNREVELSQISHIGVDRRPFEKLLGTGNIRILCYGQSTPLVLEGVRHPDHIALKIRERVQRAQE